MSSTTRMSDAEAIMWAVEKDPSLRCDFTNVTVLDHAPDEDRLRAKVESALVQIPRLGQRVVSPPLRIAPPEWRDDPTFDLDYHLRRVAVAPPGGLRELLDLTALLSASPLDRSRPLWEFTVVTGMERERAALVQRVHHTITDGVGGLKLSLSLVDLEAEPEGDSAVDVVASHDAEPPDPLPRTSPLDVLGDAVGFSIGRNRELVQRGVGGAARLVLHPTEVPGRAAGVVQLAGSVRRQVLVTQPGRSRLLAKRSLGRRFEVFSVPLEEAHRVAHSLGGSLNDFYVTGVAGALGLYHDRMGVPVDELRMAMPVSTRDRADAAANRFAPTRVLVPVGPKEPAARFARVRERLVTLRDEPAIAAAESLSALLGVLPTSLLVNATRTQSRTIDFATSNLRGSPVDLFIGGARIAANYPMGPRVGCPLNVTLLSYRGELHMGLNIDPAAISDPATLLECFGESFDELLLTP